MADWPEVALGSVLPFHYGKSLPDRDRTQSGEFNVVSSAGVVGTHSSALTSGPSVVIGRKGSIGTLYFNPNPVFPIDTAFYVEGSDQVDVRFAYYLLRTLPLPEMNNDSAVPGLNRSQAEALEIALPSVGEQLSIVTTLGALDDKIASNRLVTTLSVSLLDAMSAKLSSSLPSITLREIAAVPRTTARPSDLGAQIVDHFSLPAFDAQQLPDRVPATEIMSNKLLVGAPSVLVSRLNPRINRTWFAVPESGVPALASTEFMILDPSCIDELGALWLAVRDESFMSELVCRVTGTSGSHQRIRPDDALSIPVPDFRQLDSSQKAEVLSLLFLTHQKEIESRRLARLRDVLLPELLSGRLCVPVDEKTAEIAS